jgi:hypothetical protein
MSPFLFSLPYTLIFNIVTKVMAWAVLEFLLSAIMGDRVRLQLALFNITLSYTESTWDGTRMLSQSVKMLLSFTQW